MIGQYTLGNIQDLESPEAIKRFLKVYASQFHIQERCLTFSGEIEIKCKMTINDTGIDIEFLTEEDRDRFIFLQENSHSVKLTQI